jgi:hypothetical protein
VTLISILLLCLTTAVVPAQAVVVAHFRAQLTGSYDFDETITEFQCYPAGSEPDTPPGPPASGNVTDRTTFTTSGRFVVENYGGGYLGAANLHPLPIAVSDVRGSSFLIGDSPFPSFLPACHQGFPSQGPEPCGTRTKTYEGDIRSGSKPYGIVFDFKQGSVPDPFDGCGAAGSRQIWFGSGPLLEGKLPRQGLFDRHRRVLFVHASRTHQIKEGSSETELVEANALERYTVKLTRIG